MCLILDVDYEDSKDMVIMSYEMRNTKQKRLEILDGLRQYIRNKFTNDKFIGNGNFNFFCFGNFLDSDDDITVVNFYVYARKWYPRIITQSITMYLNDIGLNVFVLEYDSTDINDLDKKALLNANWYYDNAFTDEFSEVLDKIRHSNGNVDYSILAKKIV